MKMVAISIVSWLAGLGAYLGAVGLFWDQGISSGDLRAVVLGSALASALAVMAAYAPAMFALRRRSSGGARWWLFPVVSVALGLTPVALIIMLFGGGPRSFASPEAMLFYVMFTAFGLAFGTGFYLAYVQPAA